MTVLKIATRNRVYVTRNTCFRWFDQLTALATI